MKFAIRDDDLNYFYTPKFIEENIKDIWDICPISMSAVPFIKGNWIENTKILENLGPKNISNEIIDNIKKDDIIYDIADNKDLVQYIKRKILDKKIYLTIHAIHHRNEDDIIPVLGNNFSIGAEFYTDRDLSNGLSNAVKHLENIFGQTISVFTPPQNLYNRKGYKSILNNKLNICGYPIQQKKDIFKYFSMYGFGNTMKLLLHKKIHGSIPFPSIIHTNTISIIDHRSLQPGTDIDKLYQDFDYVYSVGGDFVLSTHSYGFNFKMKNNGKTMGEILKEFLLYVKSKDNVEFVTLDQIFR